MWVVFGMILLIVGDLFMVGLILIGYRLIGGMVIFVFVYCFYVKVFL